MNMSYHGSQSRDTILQVIEWSFEALGKGEHPACDPWGRPFTSSYCPQRRKLAGCKLAGGFFGVFDGVQADQEFLKKTFQLQRTSFSTWSN
ncbi:unnamed protein product [Symbiodinium natans]|uniref:Uncharacterized protein n=1 Tax=Symbiodinium natans TaxID=878477 RepID=A0A812G530_9DINO|nr:unnamed protein product [Symbiodinium natans]CAE7233211.1 unnamed protein product [Symbiodinium natans]